LSQETTPLDPCATLTLVLPLADATLDWIAAMADVALAATSIASLVERQKKVETIVCRFSRFQ
jgi:hypothetical protein